jgi:hypothetical protein
MECGSQLLEKRASYLQQMNISGGWNKLGILKFVQF